MKKTLFCIGSSVAVLAWASGAFAQEAASQPTQSLEEIVVTAQRRGENLQRVPIAVSAVTAATAEALGVRGTQDLTTVTPGLNFTVAVGNATPFLRGVGTMAVTAGQESSVALYVDGVYISSTSGSVFSLNNIERVEVLKGPQGTLFGRNATGGLIHVVTRDPSQEPKLEASIGYGNFETSQAKLYATTGITDTLAVDFAAYYQEQGEGWGKNRFSGREVNKVDSDLALRTKLQFTPSDATRITLALDYSNLEGTAGVATRPLEGSVAVDGTLFTGGFWDTLADFKPSLRSEAYGGSLKVEQDFSAARVVSLTAYRHTRASQNFDFDGTGAPLLAILLNPFERQFSQELQILSPESSSINWIVGGYYFRSDARYDPVQQYLYPALTHAPGTIVNTTLSQQITNSIAAFAQATFPLGEATRLTTGIRYTHDRRSLDGTAVQQPSFLPPIPPTVIPRQKDSAGQATWRIALDHDFTPTVLGYVSYNRGFKSGLFNAQDLSQPPVDAEQIDAYEAGLKMDLLDRRLRVNVAGFYYDYSNIQLQRVSNGIVQLLNAASAEVYGADAEVTAIPVEGLTLRGGLSLLHSRYGDFPGAVLSTPNRDPATGALVGGNTFSSFNADGKHTVNSPEYTVNLSATYETRVNDHKLSFSASYFRSGRFYWEVDNRTSQEPYDLVSGEASWTLPSDRFTVRLWGRNLTDTEYYTQVTQQEIGDGAIAAAPRTFGVALDFTF